MFECLPLPTLDRLNELLKVVEIPPDKYGKWSGLVRKVSRGSQLAGSVAGSRRPCDKNPGRVNWVVSVDNIRYYASRVIYYMTYGENPGSAQIDHKDQNWLNNNARNLRIVVDSSVQKVNSPMYRNNISGVVGVHWNKVARKWQAEVRSESKKIYLGLFICKIEAAYAVNKTWIELGWTKVGRKLNDLQTVACSCEKCYHIDKTT